LTYVGTSEGEKLVFTDFSHFDTIHFLVQFCSLHFISCIDWADIMLVAPLSAHTLAKISHGFCDDTLSCVIRAWDFGHGPRPGKPLLLAPAMNTAMWEHPLTQTQLSTIQGFCNTNHHVSRQLNDNHDNTNVCDTNSVRIIAPQVKTLACGEIGNGALASVDEILRVVSDVNINDANTENPKTCR
jgi:phosphopantothenoylcysteine synthetase/decarboxylase